MEKGLERKTYVEQLSPLGLFIPEQTEGRPHSCLIAVSSFQLLLMGGSRGAGTDLFSLVTDEWHEAMSE